MEIICGVYEIYNTLTHEFYIGSSRDVRSRVRFHKNRLMLHTSSHKPLQESFDKYGLDAFEWDVLVTCDKDYLRWYEQQFVDQWKPAFNTSLTASGGNGGANKGLKQSQATKDKISAAHAGKHLSAEHKSAVSLSLIGNTRRNGKKMPESAKKAIAYAMHTRVISEETRARMSAASKRRHSKEKA